MRTQNLSHFTTGQKTLSDLWATCALQGLLPQMRLLPLYGRVLGLDGCPLRRPMVLAAWLLWTGFSLPLPRFPRTPVTRRRSVNLSQLLPYNIAVSVQILHMQEDQSIPKVKVYPVTINDLVHGKDTLQGALWVDVLPGTPDALNFTSSLYSNMNPINLKASTLMGNSISASSLLLVMTTITISCWRENYRS